MIVIFSKIWSYVISYQRCWIYDGLSRPFLLWSYEVHITQNPLRYARPQSFCIRVCISFSSVPRCDEDLGFFGPLKNPNPSLKKAPPNLAKMTEQMTVRGTLKGHNGWVTQIATTPQYPDMILSASRGEASPTGSANMARITLSISHLLSMALRCEDEICVSDTWKINYIYEGI